MCRTCALLAILVVLVSATTRASKPTPGPRVIRVHSAEELARLLESPLDDTRIELLGVYDLAPRDAVDPTCGNCERPDVTVPFTAGIVVSGRNVWIVGSPDAPATIRTHAGYGVYFKDCETCGIENVIVTGGERDTSAQATDAAIVARDASVTIRDCAISGNIGDPACVAKTIVGIAGICGREHSDLTIDHCDITRNSWDGVALYRDAHATITNTLIDGVDQAHGGDVGGGRGVGIGVTWNARATIERTWVRRYWKGIGVFVDADVTARGNIVEDMLTWGIAVWDAGRGKPRAVLERNVVYDCGACGVAITRQAPYAPGETPGRFVGNIVVHTGQNPKYDSPDAYCDQCALALHAVPEGFAIRGNTFFDNRTAADSLFNADTTREMFWRGRRGWVRTFRNTEVGVDGRHRFYESAFLSRYARWLD
jgi:Right handed beta helix region